MRTLILASALLLASPTLGCNSSSKATSDPATAASTGSAASSAAPAPTRTASAEAAPKPTDEGAAEKAAEVGEPAPDFELTSLSGETHRLSQYKGKTVVLEWFNPDCPFVRNAHTVGNLKDTSKYREGDVVWLAINSGGAGKQGHGKETNEAGKKKYGIDYPILFDPDGTVGHAYGAERTPHIYVIDPKGVLVYAGALDDSRSGEPEDFEGDNYLLAALTSVKDGKPVETASTKAWGCSVKYAK